MVVLARSSERNPEDMRTQPQTDGVVAGALHPFIGLIDRQDGTPRLAAGGAAGDGTLPGLNFRVEGNEGVIPNRSPGASRRTRW